MGRSHRAERRRTIQRIERIPRRHLRSPRRPAQVRRRGRSARPGRECHVRSTPRLDVPTRARIQSVRQPTRAGRIRRDRHRSGDRTRQRSDLVSIRIPVRSAIRSSSLGRRPAVPRHGGVQRAMEVDLSATRQDHRTAPRPPSTMRQLQCCLRGHYGVPAVPAPALPEGSLLLPGSVLNPSDDLGRVPSLTLG